jgi:APA family basic amino acid/polyamine antiporter
MRQRCGDSRDRPKWYRCFLLQLTIAKESATAYTAAMSTETSPSRPGLVRVLGPVMGAAVVVGTVIGSGIFKKPQAVATSIPYVGLAAIVWVLLGLLVLLGALAYAEVAILFPRAGGNYVFLREAYGRLAGFLWGWVDFWIIRGASLAALATLFTNSLHAVLREAAGVGPGTDLLGYWPQRLVTVGVILFLTLVNVRGVRWGGVLQLFITLVKVGSLLTLIALPFLVAGFAPVGSSAARPQLSNLQPLWPESDQFSFTLLSNFISALLAVLWAYHGWMNISPVAGEIRNPQRNIPFSLLTGVGIIIALYLGTNLSYALVLTQTEMSKMKETKKSAELYVLPDGAVSEAEPQVDETVAIGFCRRLIGPIGVAFAAAAVMCSVFGALNGNLLVAPRTLYAMGEDGLAPRALGAVHATYRTPAVAILSMGVWASLLVVGVALLTQVDVLKPDQDHFDVLTNFAMFGVVIFETLAVCSIFIFRRTMPKADRPYRCWGYPVVPALYVILPALILGNMFVSQRTEAVAGVAFIAAGVAVYYLMVPRANGASPA